VKQEICWGGEVFQGGLGSGPSGIGTMLGIYSEIVSAPHKFDEANQLKICIFEKSEFPGQGTPYNFDGTEPEHLVNMPFESMQLSPGDLSEWLSENEVRAKNLIKEKLEPCFKEKFYKCFGIQYEDHMIDDYATQFGAKFLEIKLRSDNYMRDFELRYLDFSRDEIYLPRIIFGQYLQDRFHSTIDNLVELGVDIEVRPNTEVIGIEFGELENQQKQVVSRNNLTEIELAEHFDEIIIATGHWQDQKFCGHSSHLNSVWPSQNFKIALNRLILEKSAQEPPPGGALDRDFRIIIHGSSLSAIDAIKTIIFDEGFFELGVDGKISFVAPKYIIKKDDGTEIEFNITIDLVSRNGLLPKVRGKYGDYENKHLNKENVDAIIKEKGGFIELVDVFDLLNKDIRSAYEEAGIVSSIDHILKVDDDTFLQLAADLNSARFGDGPDENLIWQTIYHQSSDLFLEIYSHILPQDKLLYESFIKTLHFVHVAPMPKQSAEELLALHEVGLLHIKSIGKGGIYHIREDGKPEIIYEDGRSNSYDLSVVATGQDGKANNNPSLLFKKLLEEGHLTTQKEVISREITLNGALTEVSCKNHYLI